jgi:hypothetical protein
MIVTPHSIHNDGSLGIEIHNGSEDTLEFDIRLHKGGNMGQELATYPSGSNPAKQYHIILGNDGVTYCDCMGWKMNKHCKHLDDYCNKQGNFPNAKVSKAKLAKKDPEPKLNTTIDRIVEEIRSGQ